MKILDSINCRANLVSSTIEEDIINGWDENEPYPINVEVEYEEKIYISNADNNLGVIPPNDTTKWSFKRPSNRGAVWDDYPSTVSKNTNQDITLKFNSNDNTRVVVSGISGQKLIIELKDKNTGVRTHYEEINLIQVQQPQDIWEYFFKYFKIKIIQNAVVKIPIYYGQELSITITRKDGIAEIGFVRIGNWEQLGCTVYKAKWEDIVENRNRRVEGKLQIVKSVGGSTLNLLVSLHWDADYYEVRKRLREYRNRPIVVSGDDGEIDKTQFIIGVYSHIEESIEYDRHYTIAIDSIDDTI